jgi:hypothetical protein
LFRTVLVKHKVAFAETGYGKPCLLAYRLNVQDYQIGGQLQRVVRFCRLLMRRRTPERYHRRHETAWQC